MPSAPRSVRLFAHTVTAVIAYVSLASFAHAPATAASAGADALARLRAGNERFVRGLAPDAATASGAPVAMVLSCADVRTAPELVFGAAPGQLYVVRSLGQVADRAVLASLEHGAGRLHVPLLVVMGHDHCAAVAAAVDAPTNALSSHLDYLMQAIRAGLPRSADERKDVRRMVLANVEQVINDVLGNSPQLRSAVGDGQLHVVGAYYESGTGQVVFSDAVGLSTSWH